LQPPAPWSVAGAAAPVDFAGAVTQSNRITTSPGPYTFASNPQMVAEVQDWLGSPGSNFGWIVISQLQGVGQTELKFSSRESASGKPRLVVDYVLPALPPTLTLLPVQANQFRFRFVAESNRSYTVEQRGGLPGEGWGVLTQYPAQAVPTNFTVGVPLEEGLRLYRVRTP